MNTFEIAPPKLDGEGIEEYMDRIRFRNNNKKEPIMVDKKDDTGLASNASAAMVDDSKDEYKTAVASEGRLPDDLRDDDDQEELPSIPPGTQCQGMVNSVDDGDPVRCPKDATCILHGKPGTERSYYCDQCFEVDDAPPAETKPTEEPPAAKKPAAKKAAPKPKPSGPSPEVAALNTLIAQNGEIIKQNFAIEKHLRYATLMKRAELIAYGDKKAAKALKEEANALFGW